MNGIVYVAHVVNGVVDNTQVAWTGTQSGGDLSIVFLSILGFGGQTWHATWHGGALLVTYQDTNTGQLVSVPFVAASTSDYNNAVVALQKTTH